MTDRIIFNGETEAVAFQRNNLGLFTLDIGTVETLGEGTESVDPDLVLMPNVDTNARDASPASGNHKQLGVALHAFEPTDEGAFGFDAVLDAV